MNGGVTYNGETTVSSLTHSLQLGKVPWGISGGETVTAGFLQDVESLCFGSHGGDGGVELPKLVFVFLEPCDVGSKAPIAKVDSRIMKELIV